MRNRTPKTYTSPKDAMAQLGAVLKQHLPLIPGLARGCAERLDDPGAYVNLEWDRAWGVGASLSVHFGHGGLEQDETRFVHKKTLRVEVSWSSTGRTPAEAMAAIALYQQVAQLACLLEGVGSRLEVAEVTEKPVAKPEVA